MAVKYTFDTKCYFACWTKKKISWRTVTSNKFNAIYLLFNNFMFGLKYSLKYNWTDSISCLKMKSCLYWVMSSNFYMLSRVASFLLENKMEWISRFKQKVDLPLSPSPSSCLPSLSLSLNANSVTSILPLTWVFSSEPDRYDSSLYSFVGGNRQ